MRRASDRANRPSIRPLAAAGVLIAIGEAAGAATPDTLAKPLDGDTFNVFVADQYFYDDNIYRLPSRTTDVAALVGPGATLQDHIDSVSGGVVGQWVYSAQALGVDLRADDNRYSRNTALDNTSGHGKAVWDWSLGAKWLLEAGGDFTRSLASFANNKYFKRDLIDRTEYFGNAQFQFGAHWDVAGGVRELQVTHSAPAFALDRFHSKTEDFDIEYATIAENKFGWEYEHTEGRLPLGAFFEGFSFNRDFQDDTAQFKINYSLAGKTQITASSGYLKRRYESTPVGAFSGAIWTATVQWQPSAKTQVVFASSRELTAYLEAESSYFASTGGSVSLIWQPSERITLSLKGSHLDQNYIASGVNVIASELRRDKVSAQEAVLDYAPRRPLSFKLSYGLEQRQSNQSEFQYDDKLARVGVTYTF